MKLFLLLYVISAILFFASYIFQIGYVVFGTLFLTLTILFCIFTIKEYEEKDDNNKNIKN